MSVTLKPVIYAQYRRKDGTYPVRIRLTYQRSSRFLSTTIAAMPSQLTKGLNIKDPVLAAQVDDLVRDIRKVVTKLNLFALEKMSVDDVVDFIKRNGQAAFALDFPAYARKIIATKGKGAKNYTSALNSFNAFLSRDAYDISIISSSLMVRYQRWLEERHGKNARAVSLYTQAIAHIHGLARREYNDEELQLFRISNPFAHYTCPDQQQGQHRNAPPAIINLMLQYRSELTGRERIGVDMFLLSFALMGMNIPDLYEARQAVGGVITYQRIKTRDRRTDGAEMKVRIEQPFAWLLDEYRGKNGFLLNLRDRYADYRYLEDAANKGLHRFEKRLGISQNLTVYVARHTWATAARSSVCGIDKSVVNDCLCHVEEGMKVTDIYAEKDWQVVWDANAKVQRLFEW